MGRRRPRLTEYPNVRRLGDHFVEDHSAIESEESLENPLDRIALLRGKPTSPRLQNVWAGI
jgi:hypothetical protein